MSLRRGDRPDPCSNEEAFAYLTVAVKDADAQKVGRNFANRVVEMALASYPGFTMTGPPSAESQIGVYWPALVPSAAVEHRVVIGEEVIEIPPVALAAASGARAGARRRAHAGAGSGRRRRARSALGAICGARSGDKGGNANVGVWVRSAGGVCVAGGVPDRAKLRELIAEARELAVDRYELPNLLALNFVIKGLLGDGVAASLRSDPQAKSAGRVPARQGGADPHRATLLTVCFRRHANAVAPASVPVGGRSPPPSVMRCAQRLPRARGNRAEAGVFAVYFPSTWRRAASSSGKRNG